MKTKLASFSIAGLCVLALNFGAAATTMTFDVNTTWLSGGWNLSGTIAVDVTAGAVTALNIDFRFDSTVLDQHFVAETFTDLTQSNSSGTEWTVGSTLASHVLDIMFTTTNPGSLIGFNGGTITDASFTETCFECFFSLYNGTG